MEHLLSPRVSVLQDAKAEDADTQEVEFIGCRRSTQLHICSGVRNMVTPQDEVSAPYH